jgi:hypothetical protein
LRPPGLPTDRGRWYAAGMELRPLARGVYACLQPDNGLGTSNSGLIDRGGGLVVDTFWDLPHTRRLIATYERVRRDPGPSRRQYASQRRPLLGQPALSRRGDHRPPQLRRRVRAGAPRGDAGAPERGGQRRPDARDVRAPPRRLGLQRDRADATHHPGRRPSRARARRHRRPTWSTSAPRTRREISSSTCPRRRSSSPATSSSASARRSAGTARPRAGSGRSTTSSHSRRT